MCDFCERSYFLRTHGEVTQERPGKNDNLPTNYLQLFKFRASAINKNDDDYYCIKAVLQESGEYAAWNDQTTSCVFKIKYCPICGKKL